MENTPLYKMPTIDASAKSLLIIAQLGCFASFTWWGLQDSAGIDYIFPVMTGVAGLALFLSVPNARMGATLGIPAVMVVMGAVTGEFFIMFWAVFMLIMVGTLAYLPALATNDATLGLDDSTRMKRVGLIYLVLAVFMAGMFSGLMEGATGGEITDTDSDENDIVLTLDSTEKTAAQAGLAMVSIGTVVFLLTAMMGVELGSLRPWHGGALLAGGMWVSLYMWYSAADHGIGYLISEAPFALAISGIFILAAHIAYESSDAAEDSKTDPPSQPENDS